MILAATTSAQQTFCDRNHGVCTAGGAALQIVLIIVIAVLVRAFSNRTIRRLVSETADGLQYLPGDPVRGRTCLRKGTPRLAMPGGARSRIGALARLVAAELLRSWQLQLCCSRCGFL